MTEYICGTALNGISMVPTKYKVVKEYSFEKLDEVIESVKGFM